MSARPYVVLPCHLYPCGKHWYWCRADLYNSPQNFLTAGRIASLLKNQEVYQLITSYSCEPDAVSQDDSDMVVVSEAEYDFLSPNLSQLSCSKVDLSPQEVIPCSEESDFELIFDNEDDCEMVSSSYYDDFEISSDSNSDPEISTDTSESVYFDTESLFSVEDLSLNDPSPIQQATPPEPDEPHPLAESYASVARENIPNDGTLKRFLQPITDPYATLTQENASEFNKMSSEHLLMGKYELSEIENNYIDIKPSEDNCYQDNNDYNTELEGTIETMVRHVIDSDSDPDPDIIEEGVEPETRDKPVGDDDER